MLHLFYTLCWLKWTLFKNELRTPHMVWGTVLLGLVGALGVGVSLLASAFIFVTLVGYAEADSPTNEAAAASLISVGIGSSYLLFFFLSLLPTRSGSTFDIRRLRHYPIPQCRLFFLDTLSEWAQGVLLLSIAPLLALHLTLPVVVGRPLWGLPPLLLTLCISSLLGQICRSSVALLLAIVWTRARIMAILGAGLLATYLALRSHPGSMLLEHASIDLSRLANITTLLPHSLTSDAIIAILRPDNYSYATTLGLECTYVLPLYLLAYGLWNFVLTHSRFGVAEVRVVSTYTPWTLPRLDPVFTALLEKELRCLVRNPLVRHLFLLPFVLIFLRINQLFLPGYPSTHDQAPTLDSGPPDILILAAVAYTLLLFSTLINNQFGLDGSGFRAYVLSPASRRSILLAKNTAILILLALEALLALWVNHAIFADLDLRAVVIVLGALSTGSLLMVGVGNFLSMRFPRSMKSGRRVVESPWSVIFGVVELPFVLSPALLAVAVAGWLDGALVAPLIILLSTLPALLLYFRKLLPMAARELERVEAFVGETLAGRRDS